MAGKGDLVDRVAKDTGMSKAQVNKVVDATLEALSSMLNEGGSVSLPGFGTFRVSETKERQGRNPRTGAAMTIPAGRRVGFSAGSKLSSSVRGGGGS